MFRGGFKLFTILGDRCRECPGLAPVRQWFLISWGKLGNRCKVMPFYARLCAAILDFRPRLGNRCKVFPVYTLLRALILDFRPRLGNRCKVFPVYTLFRASILDFKPKLANRCSVSSLQRRMARLQPAATPRNNDVPRPILIFVAKRGEAGFATTIPTPSK